MTVIYAICAGVAVLGTAGLIVERPLRALYRRGHRGGR